ncbi:MULTISPECIES: hypothetical protein [Bacillus cereus group]|uniref:hypothetical protein n=1 Tax=Bacillus cereus group TaxID=86661 RepID=UPI000B4437A7|nr:MULTISPECIES: hypothetical protein [Bacillus cereus group]MED2040923.1 hypothetical protein [Bacillus wiedmannii]MED3025580.1 hypothetical protein [Bacillus wiedmannii]OTY00463.1 hypothetical protein BK729_09380 [Bacillus thuringiensis serovar wratislaviensis]OUB61974.1 hypothetical protein BK743_07595 [Bacillus thuringiensis serovar sylvestriensis]
MIDYYQIFLFTMAGIALFSYIQHAGKPTKRNKWRFFVVVFLFFLFNYLFLKFVYVNVRENTFFCSKITVRRTFKTKEGYRKKSNNCHNFCEILIN